MRFVVPALLIPLALPAPAPAKPLAARQTLIQWADAFNAGKPDDVAALYLDTATLWGTVTPTLTPSPTDVRAYFDRAAKAGLKVRIVDHSATELSDGVVVEAGRYTFERTQEGRTVDLPARYTFVLVKQGEAWKIAHQHSSPMPK